MPHDFTLSEGSVFLEGEVGPRDDAVGCFLSESGIETSIITQVYIYIISTKLYTYSVRVLLSGYGQNEQRYTNEIVSISVLHVSKTNRYTDFADHGTSAGECSQSVQHVYVCTLIFIYIYI